MKIKFFLYPYATPENSHYQHNIIALSQGFKEIGIEHYANIDYWYDPIDKEYLILKAYKGYNADIHVYSTSYLRNTKNIFLDYSKTNIYIDSSDGLLTEVCNPNFYPFDIILKVHYNKSLPFPSHVKPWAFGLVHHMIDAVDKTLSNSNKYEILNNLRQGHSLRNFLMDELSNCKKYRIDPIHTFTLNKKENQKHHHYSYWSQTGRRFDLNYYQCLNESLFTYSFGGYIFPKIIEPHLNSRFFVKSFKARIKLNTFSKFRLFTPLFLGQFDNFRFWDSLYANTATIHIDLGRYGCKLPEMPINWKHYIGIENIHSISNFLDKLESLTDEEIASITLEGRKWVIDNYAPKAVAQRFVSLFQLVPQY